MEMNDRLKMNESERATTKKKRGEKETKFVEML